MEDAQSLSCRRPYSTKNGAVFNAGVRVTGAALVPPRLVPYIQSRPHRSRSNRTTRRPRRQEQVRSRDDREASEADRHSDGHTATNSPAPSSVCSPTAEDVSHHNGATEIYDFDDGVASATPLKLQLGDRTQHMSDQHFSDTVTEARLPPSSRSSTLRQPVVESRKHQTPQ
ncbi:hypothetical protein JG687_00000871 [Phytophthora cactorum]|uniref:Uncharacterized protein n=1 Tax=Phytophthora cactorum TaxID=29920 RepID=A0A8T1UZH0_9STRA|nr:hypothetical protein JG687_00000871 [Phytophthora cactorum]